MRRIVTLVSFPNKWRKDIEPYVKSGQIIRYEKRNGFVVSAIYKREHCNHSLQQIQESPGLVIPAPLRNLPYAASNSKIVKTIDGIQQTVDSDYALMRWRQSNFFYYASISENDTQLIGESHCAQSTISANSPVKPRRPKNRPTKNRQSVSASYSHSRT